VNLKKRRYVRPELDRLMFEALHSVAGRPAAAVAKHSGLSPSTIRKMRTKITRYPHASTLIAIAKVGGFSLSIVPSETIVDRKPVKRARGASEIRAL